MSNNNPCNEDRNDIAQSAKEDIEQPLINANAAKPAIKPPTGLPANDNKSGKKTSVRKKDRASKTARSVGTDSPKVTHGLPSSASVVNYQEDPVNLTWKSEPPPMSAFLSPESALPTTFNQDPNSIRRMSISLGVSWIKNLRTTSEIGHSFENESLY